MLCVHRYINPKYLGLIYLWCVVVCELNVDVIKFFKKAVETNVHSCNNKDDRNICLHDTLFW